MVSQPTPTDPYVTAKAQGGENSLAAMYNAIIGNPNEVNPFGQSTNQVTSQIPVYDRDGKIAGYAPQFTKTTTLSPAQQGLLDLENKTKTQAGTTANQLMSNMQKTWSKPMDTSKMRPWSNIPQYSPQQFSDERGRVEKALYGRMMEKIAPQQEAENVALANQGLDPGGHGYGTVQKTQADVRGSAANDAILAGGQEQS